MFNYHSHYLLQSESGVNRDKLIQTEKNVYEGELTGDKVIVGDPKSANFKPKVTLNCWKEECSIILGVPEISDVGVIGDNDAGIQEGKAKWSTPDFDLNLFEQPSENELGSFEYEIILKRRPPSNVLSIPINLNGLAVSYQDTLAKELEGNEGYKDYVITDTEVRKDGKLIEYRPENVVGSYAVFHATKRNHIRGQTNYRSGKAFHLYRPLLTDFVGQKKWAVLSITGGKLNVAMDGAWLDSAVYPVIIDPNFGKDWIGGTASAYQCDRKRGSFATGAVFNCDSITMYVEDTLGGWANVKYALYTRTGLNGVLLAGSGTALSPVASGWKDWKTLPCLTPPMMAAVSYWILWWFDAGCDSAQYFRDYLANGGGAEAGGIAAWPANVALTSEPHQYSIYGTYTGLGWAGKIAGVTDPAYIGGVDIADIAEVKGVASA